MAMNYKPLPVAEVELIIGEYMQAAVYVQSRFFECGIAGSCTVEDWGGWPCLSVRYVTCNLEKVCSIRVFREDDGRWSSVRNGVVNHYHDTLGDLVDYVSLFAFRGVRSVGRGGALTAEQVQALDSHAGVARVLPSACARKRVVVVSTEGSVCELSGVFGGGVFASVHDYVVEHCVGGFGYPTCGMFTLRGASEMEPVVWADMVVDRWRRQVRVWSV